MKDNLAKEQISLQKAKIKDIDDLYKSRIQSLSNKRDMIKIKQSYKSAFSALTNSKSSVDPLKEVEKLNEEISKVSEERALRLSKEREKLIELKSSFIKDCESNKERKRKEQEVSKKEIKLTLKKNVPLIISIGTVLILALWYFISDGIKKGIERGRDYYISVEDNFSFSCDLYFSSDSSPKCSEKRISGSFSNYETVEFDWDYYYAVNDDSFERTISSYIPSRMYQVYTFDKEKILGGFDDDVSIELKNTILGKIVKAKNVKIHYSFSQNDIDIIEKYHEQWVEKENKNKEEREREEQRKEEEKARQEKEKEEARKREEEEKAAKEEESKSYLYSRLEDDGSCRKNAKFCYTIDDSAGYPNYDWGTIKGRIINNTGKDVSYLQISFSMYDTANSKTGDCFASVGGIKVGGTWSFEAYCTSWPKGGRYSDLEITYW